MLNVKVQVYCNYVLYMYEAESKFLWYINVSLRMITFSYKQLALLFYI